MSTGNKFRTEINGERTSVDPVKCLALIEEGEYKEITLSHWQVEGWEMHGPGRGPCVCKDTRPRKSLVHSENERRSM